MDPFEKGGLPLLLLYVVALLKLYHLLVIISIHFVRQIPPRVKGIKKSLS
jgi:hypothetical protein